MGKFAVRKLPIRQSTTTGPIQATDVVFTGARYVSQIGVQKPWQTFYS